MYFKVSLDTNCFETTGFMFDNALFNQMRSYVNQGILNLQINAVVEGKVRNHIQTKIPDVINRIRKIVKSEHYLAGFRDINEGIIKAYDKKFSCLSIPDDNIWVDDALKKFDILLNDLAVERIPVDRISIGDMLNDYFRKRPPFEERKPYEFKDAIIIRSVLMEIECLSRKNRENESDGLGKLVFEDKFDAPVIIDGELYREDDGALVWNSRADEMLYLVVSSDGGVRKALQDAVKDRPNEDVKIFEKLPDLLSYITKQEHMAFMLDELLVHNYCIDEIAESARVAIEMAEVDIEGYDGYLEEVEIESVELEDSSASVIGVQRFSDDNIFATITVYATLIVTVVFTYMNEDQSPWDRETKSYLWRTIEKNQAQFSTGIDLMLQLDVSDIIEVLDDEKIDTTTKGGQQQLNIWAEKQAKIMEMIDYPDSIYLYLDEMIKNENIDSRDEYD